MNRLVVVRCPDLLDEDEGGEALRSFDRVIGAVEAYCPWVTPVRPGICSLPALGPARYFGGEDRLASAPWASSPPCPRPMCWVGSGRTGEPATAWPGAGAGNSGACAGRRPDDGPPTGPSRRQEASPASGVA